MNTRLKQFLSAENITQAQFADNINVVRASVSHVLSGRNNPSYEFIRSIMMKYPKLNIEWLMFGKGKMYKEPEAQENPGTHSPSADVLFPEFEDEKPEIEEITEITTSIDSPDVVVNQRKVSKVIILFDDGTFQEM